MTTPKESLEQIANVETSLDKTTLLCQIATMKRIAAEALASLQGEDAVERVARIPHAEVDKIVADLMSANYSDKPRLAVAIGRAIVKANERGLATGIVTAEAAIRASAFEEAARIAEGEVYKERYRTWPWWKHDADNIGNADRESALVKHADAIAAAIRSGGGE